jgi:hypothetical protein
VLITLPRKATPKATLAITPSAEPPVLSTAPGDTDKSIKVIMYFNDRELEKFTRIMKELERDMGEDIILIDSTPKVSASKADES